MSVAEMKLEAIKRIINTDDEVVVQKILAFLEEIAAKNAPADLFKNYDAIKEQRGDILQKLAHNNVTEPDLLPHVETIVKERDEVLKKLAE